MAQEEGVSQAVEGDKIELEPKLAALLKGYPLYTPLFGEQRLKVHTVLESLRREGWLKQQTASDGAML